MRKRITRGLTATSIIFFLSAFLTRAETGGYLPAPIEDNDRELHRDILKTELVTSAGNYGVITFMHASLGEWAVVADSIKQAPRKTREYQLTLSSAVDNLNRRTVNAKKATEVPVKRKSVKIDRNFALAIRGTCRAILSQEPTDQTRAPSRIGSDGFSAVISVKMANGKITRRTYSAQKPPESEIVNLGNDLREYCLSPPLERKNNRDILVEKLNTFNKQFAGSSDTLSSKDVIASRPTLWMSAGKPTASAESRSFNGVTATLKINNPVIKVGEDLKITVEYRNTTNRTVNFRFSNLDWDAELYRKGEAKPIVGGFVGEAAYDEITLNPGESYRYEDLFHMKGWPNLLPGDYEISFAYHLGLLSDKSLVRRYLAKYPHNGYVVPWSDRRHTFTLVE